MVHPAIFGAEEMKASRFGRLKPDDPITPLARQHIGFYAERGHEEAVDHVLARHRQLDAAPERHVQFVDLALAAKVLEPPHPLPGRDVNLHRLFRRAIDGVIEARAPDENHQADQERDADPGSFDGVRRGGPRWNLSRRAAAVFDREIDFEPGDQRDEEHRDADQREVEGVDTAREIRRVFGQERNEQRSEQPSEREEAVIRGLHAPPPFFALRFNANNNATTPISVKPPPSRSDFITAAPYLPVFGSYW